MLNSNPFNNKGPAKYQINFKNINDNTAQTTLKAIDGGYAYLIQQGMLNIQEVEFNKAINVLKEKFKLKDDKIKRV